MLHCGTAPICPSAFDVSLSDKTPPFSSAHPRFCLKQEHHSRVWKLFSSPPFTLEGGALKRDWKWKWDSCFCFHLHSFFLTPIENNWLGCGMTPWSGLELCGIWKVEPIYAKRSKCCTQLCVFIWFFRLFVDLATTNFLFWQRCHQVHVSLFCPTPPTPHTPNTPMIFDFWGAGKYRIRNYVKSQCFQQCVFWLLFCVACTFIVI